MSQRIAVLFDNLGPYHIARLKACAQVFDLLAIEYRSASTEYAWAPASDVPFKRVILREGPGDGPSSARDRLQQALGSFRPTAIAVPGWASWLAITAIRFAAAADIPIVVMSESQEVDFRRVFWKEAVKKRVLRFFDSALAGGEPHREYLVKLGMPREAISVGYDVVDNEYFFTQSEKARARADEWRVQLNLPAQYFLCAARFIPKKNLLRLLRAYRLYLHLSAVPSSGRDKWSLVLLGDGEQRAEIEAAISELGLVGRVHLPGFRQIEELPAFYALAGVFILPSLTEQWGLVVNEAMAAGLPVLVSSRCGCAQDLVQEGQNGFTFDPWDVEGLAQLMTRVALDTCARDAMGQASREIIARWSPETFAQGLLRAAGSAETAPRRRVNLLDRALLWALGSKGAK